MAKQVTKHPLLRAFRHTGQQWTEKSAPSTWAIFERSSKLLLPTKAKHLDYKALTGVAAVLIYNHQCLSGEKIKPTVLFRTTTFSKESWSIHWYLLKYTCTHTQLQAQIYTSTTPQEKNDPTSFLSFNIYFFILWP